MITNILNEIFCWPLQHDLTSKSPDACNHHPHQPSTSPLIDLHKEAQPVPLATLSKQWPHSYLNDPFQNYNVAPSIHAWIRQGNEKIIHHHFIQYHILIP